VDKRSEWLKKLDEDCPFQLTLPRRQLNDDSGIMDFCCRTLASSTCTLKTNARRMFATVSRTRWTQLFLDRGSSQKANRTGWRVELAAKCPCSTCWDAICVEVVGACGQRMLRNKISDRGSDFNRRLSNFSYPPLRY
jgi:hypothetical protein